MDGYPGEIAMATGTKHGTRYPWTKWFSQPSFLLVKGQDYDCETKNMAQQVRFASRRAEYNVKVKIITVPDPSSLIVEVKERGAKKQVV
jgi:hypothetical protein